ncbi:rod shape-determining protein MreD [Sphingomonas sp. S2-65]|uniref:rod shape-determining protein MreD n=1 Tax=Sphingomonas sp. S2-65 TaxID=2903960 RepID=UPI001F17832E|nr:rod shape-determining protein MreD [Sphingomonas sp. S2-65]UYY59171.1 rod shape-determining protein MreD [Sphingomonas sp. S2-65]
MSGIEFIPFGQSERPPRARWLAPLSVVLGSSVTLIPIVATVPMLPPFGLMMLLGWRMIRGDSMRVWAPVPLGFFDDLVSGQPLGSAMLLWTLCVLAIDVLDTRLVWRDFWQDWLIATGAVGFCLIAGRLIAAPFGAHVDTALLFQILAAAAFMPVIFRLCAWLDRDTKKA